MKLNKKHKILIAGSALSLGLVGCTAKYTEPFKDAPRSGVTNSDAADLIEMPDGFSNGSTKCDHGNRLYVAYHGDHVYAALAVVPQDPTCKVG
jgi:hypothetical protein